MKKLPALTALSPALLLLALVALAQNSKVAATDRSEWIKFNPVTQLTAASFANPPAADRPWVRMNLPPTADAAEIAAEIREMHDKGIAGVEIGQGAFPNNDQLVALYTAANQFDIKVSLSHGPTQNPPGYSIDSDHARKTLVFGKVTVNAGAPFEGPVPARTLTVNMVRPERRDVLTGGRPDRVSAGAPGSRLQAEGEIRPYEAECRKPLKERGANQRAATKVNAVASSYSQPKGVPEGRTAHITVKATDSILKPDGMLDLRGVWSGGTLGKSSAEQERPYPAVGSDKDRGYKAGRLKSRGAGRESEGFILPVKACNITRRKEGTLL